MIHALVLAAGREGGGYVLPPYESWPPLAQQIFSIVVLILVWAGIALMAWAIIWAILHPVRTLKMIFFFLVAVVLLNQLNEYLDRQRRS